MPQAEPQADLFGLPAAALQQIRQCMASFSTLDQVILYGSRAMGTERRGSDIDLVVQSEHFSHQHLLQLMTALDDLLLPYQFDICRYQDIAHQDLLAHIERVGQVFYQRGMRLPCLE